MTERVMVPAPFIGLLADMPAPTADTTVRRQWWQRQAGTLKQAVVTPNGMLAIRLYTVAHRELDRLGEPR
jgi:predicted cobalt transporter CbtA